jgi:glutamine amidotransferase
VCRHLAYVGVPRPIRELVTDPEFGLVRQAYAPRRQRHGTVNADGFGIGWYADAGAADPVPARYRRAVPIWTDAGLPDLARVVRTRALLAAVRDGTPGFPYTEQACAPFAAGNVLFSHNGALPGGASTLAALAAHLDPAELMSLESPTDSAILFALIRRHLVAGDPLTTSITQSLATLTSAPGWRNLLVTDGEVVVAVADGDSLCWRALDGGVVVASEPYDDGPGWQDVPDRHLLVATRGGVEVTPLET